MTFNSIRAKEPLSSLYSAWMKIAEALRLLSARILLGLVFFAIVSPLAVIARMLGKEFLKQGRNPEINTYREPIIERSGSMERPY